MKIGNIEIEAGQKCKIIAELGTLHHSSIENLKSATKDAFNNGADFVKIQLINPDRAFWANHHQLTRYRRLYKSFPPAKWTQYLNEMNKEYDNRVFPSVFDTDTFDKVKNIIPAVKLAYITRTKRELLNYVLKERIPTIISLGEDRFSQKLLQERIMSSSSTKVLYVKSEYPLLDCNARIPLYGSVYDGLSCHSRNFAIYAASFIAGCQLLEVHVMGSDANGNDTKFAINMEQLQRLTNLREALSSNLFTQYLSESKIQSF